MSRELYAKENYITGEKYIQGRIVEYDIKSANINCLLNSGVISKEDYDRYNNMEKHDREIAIGNLHKILAGDGINVSEIISNKIREYRYKFVNSNNIEDFEIVRIAKDAMYINRSVDIQYTTFDDNILFRKKLVASSMINLNGVLVFAWYDDHNEINIEVKGLGKNAEYHQNGMLTLIANTMYLVDRSGIQDAILYIQEAYKMYICRQLPIEYYREFNGISDYKIINSKYTLSSVNSLASVDIGYNLMIIRELYSIVFGLYVSR
jgi:hypothetical protein